MSFRIADLIGDQILNSNKNCTISTDSKSADKDKVIVSSTSDAIPKDSSNNFGELTFNRRLSNCTNSASQHSFAPIHQKTTTLLNECSTKKLELSTFDDYASKLYSNIYYDQLYLTPGLIAAAAAANSGVASYGAAHGLEKALSASYPSIYSRGRPAGWPGLYPAAPSAITHHPLSPFLYSPLVYPHYSKRKGGQVRFTTSQTDTLEKRFQSHKYLSPEDRRVLADNLKLSDRQVKTWFQNRRAKWRRCHDGSEKHSDSLECNSSDSEPEMQCAPSVRTVN